MEILGSFYVETEYSGTLWNILEQFGIELLWVGRYPFNMTITLSKWCHLTRTFRRTAITSKTNQSTRTVRRGVGQGSL